VPPLLPPLSPLSPPLLSEPIFTRPGEHDALAFQTLLE